MSPLEVDCVPRPAIAWPDSSGHVLEQRREPLRPRCSFRVEHVAGFWITAA